MSDLAVTLVEGDYHLGLGSLINSLVKRGFRGDVLVGVRREEEWIERFNADLTRNSAGCRIEPRILATDWHLASYKAHFLRDLATELRPEHMMYWDPDITLIASYDFIRCWVNGGIGVVEDGCYSSFPATHPIRRAWTVAVETQGLALRQACEHYYNSGFVGVSRAQQAFWSDWAACVDIVGKHVNLREFKPGSREDPYFGTDQDALNMATMITDQPLSVIGPDGMGFRPAGYVMQHATDSTKPWRKRFVQLALRGVAPSQADKAWLASASGPVQVLTSSEIKAKQRDLRLAAAIGRFIRRSS